MTDLDAFSHLRWEPLFALTLDVAYDRVQKIGATPLGWRGIYPVDGGHFEGARLRGIVLPGGADWVVRRADKVTMIDVRLCLQTHGGAAIAMSYTGLIRLSEKARLQQRDAKLVAYEETYIRTTPRFETGDDRYGWLNAVIAVANGNLNPRAPTYQVFAIL